MTTRRSQAVVFDLGKVLLDFDYEIAVRQLLPRSSISVAEFHSLINQSPLLLDYEIGRLSTEAFFQRVQAASGFAGTLQQFQAGFADIFTEIKPMIALHAEVRRRGLPTYILSNTNDLAIRHVRAHFPFFNTFDGYALSYEHHAMKPAPLLYEVVENLSGCSGPALFYLDDRPENVETARQRGWHVHVHENPEQSRAALAAAGFLD